MKATDIMQKEHVVIKRVLECLAGATSQAEKGGPLEVESIRKMIEFFRGFADRCHHAKEEAQFFPVARQRGVGCAPGNISILLAEHEQGRNFIREMEASLTTAEQGDSRAKARFVEHARGYTSLLAAHIDKEDHCLFPNADNMLLATDQDELARDFDKIEHEEKRSGTHARFHALADELCAKWNVPKPNGSRHHPTNCGH